MSLSAQLTDSAAKAAPGGASDDVAGVVLRFGVMCRATKIPRWQAECIRQLIRSGVAQACLFILEQEEIEGVPQRSGLHETSSYLFRLWYSAAVKPRVGALRPVDIAEEFEGIPRVTCCVKRAPEDASCMVADEVHGFQARDLDFIVRFGPGTLRGALLELPRWGVWSYSHADERRYRLGAPGFWELSNADPVQGATLQRLTNEREACVVLHRGAFRTEPTYARSLNAVLMGSADWCTRAARELALGQTTRFTSVPSGGIDRQDHLPNNQEFLAYLAQRIGVLARGLARKLFFREDWNIGLVTEPLEDLLWRGRPGAVAWFADPPRDGFIADPFLLRHGGELHVLAEEYVGRERKGRIVAAEILQNGFHGNTRPVLDLPQHLSYPFLFEWEGAVYLVPEIAEAGSIRLYRAEGSPWRWKEATTLVEGFPGLDSTIFEHQGRWWLFCTRAGKHSEYKLHAWHAPSPLGPWEPHALNPLKCDVRSSRPAGRPFILGGKLYRPAQNGARGYGSSITLNWVRHLTPTEFDEEEAGVLAPDPQGPYPDGLHTICVDGDLIVIDGKRYDFRLRRWLPGRARGLMGGCHIARSDAPPA